MKCVNCGKETNNPKFCNRSCSATWTNKNFVKRKLNEKYCSLCHEKINRKSQLDRSRLCEKCKDIRKFKDDVPLKNVIYTQHHKSSAFALVRARARMIAKKLNMNKCLICGYEKHIEICHKKPISNFSMESLISEINHRDNLVALCPNHHWEFDNKLVSL